MLRKYEVVIVFDSDLDDNGLRQQLERVEATIAAHGGAVEVRDIWGRRPLAYPIGKKQYGIFVLLVVTGDNTMVSDLRRQLRIADTVLRSFFTKKDKFAPDLVARVREESAAAEGGFREERKEPDAAPFVEGAAGDSSV